MTCPACGRQLPTTAAACAHPLCMTPRAIGRRILAGWMDVGRMVVARETAIEHREEHWKTQ